MSFAISGAASVSETNASARAVQRVVSPKGIEAWLVEEHAVPLISMELAFLGGAAQDAPALNGASRLFASLLDEGAGDLDAAAFQEKLAEYAIELSFSANRDTWRGSLKTLARHSDHAFDLLKLALTKPRFDAPSIERVREQIMAGLRHEANDPDSLANRAFFAKAFPNHPYGLPTGGSLETVAGIQRDALVELHGKALTQANLFIAVVGAIDAATLAARLDDLFADLPRDASLMDIPAIEASGAGSVAVIDVEVPQTVIRFGLPGLARRDDDYMAAVVLNHILGGGAFTSRLFQEVREKRGLAYGVSTTLLPMRSSSLLVGQTATKNERAVESLTIIRQEIDRLLADGPNEDELAKAKQYLTGSYALQFDSSAKIAHQLLQIAIDDLGIDYIDRRNSLISAVTLNDVRRAATRLFAQRSLLVAAAGRPEGLVPTEA